MNKLPISREGFIELQARLRQLKEVERPEILDAVQRARELGDLSENADYKTSKDEQRRIDAEIRRLEGIADGAEIIDISSLTGDRVTFGATVGVEDEDGRRAEYQILSEYEANPSKGVIAFTSPLARAMIGKCVGDSCIVRMPAGEKEYEITAVSYARN